jgi:hypothetical protein
MGNFLAASDGSSSSTPWVVFVCLGAVALLVWGIQKYRESQAEKRSEELRQLYASVHSQKPKG